MAVEPAKRLNLIVTPALHRLVKVQAAEAGVSMTEFILAAIREKIEKEKNVAQILITIDSELTESEFTHLQAVASHHWGQRKDAPGKNLFAQMGDRRQYAPLDGNANPADVAHHMMALIGRSFEYHVERLDA